MPGCQKPIRRGRSFVLPYTPFAFACLADELGRGGRAAGRVPPRVSRRRRRRTAPDRHAARRDLGARRSSCAARAVVDTSGDAVVARHAGAAHRDRAARRPAAALPGLRPPAGRHRGARRRGPRGLLRALLEAERDGRLPKGASNLTLAPSPQPGEVIGKLALGGIMGEHGDRRDFLTAAEQEGRRRVLRRHRVPEDAAALRPRLRLPRGAAGGRPREPAGDRTLSAHARRRPVGAQVRRRGRPGAAGPSSCGRTGQLGATYEYLEDGQTSTTSRFAACRPATSTTSSSPDAA